MVGRKDRSHLSSRARAGKRLQSKLEGKTLPHPVHSSCVTAGVMTSHLPRGLNQTIPSRSRNSGLHSCTIACAAQLLYDIFYEKPCVFILRWRACTKTEIYT